MNTSRSFISPGLVLLIVIALAVLGGVYMWRTQSTTKNSANFTATPTSGVAPLTVVFHGTVPSQFFSLDFGDRGSTGGITGGPVQLPIVLNETHTYSFPGTYTASLTFENDCAMMDTCPVDSRTTVGTATITVIGGKPSATIDQSSLVQSYQNFSITGTALNIHYIRLWISDGSGKTVFDNINTDRPPEVDVTNNRWEVFVSSIPTGTYKVKLYGYNKYSASSHTAFVLIASGTLTVQ